MTRKPARTPRSAGRGRSGLQCAICTRDTQTLACTSCVDQLVADLQTLAWLATHLEVTRSRQARLGGVGGPRDPGAGSPLGFHVGAAAAAGQLRDTLAYWLRMIEAPGGWHDEDDQTTPLLALHLVTAAHQFPQLERIAELRGDVDRHTQQALEIINPLDQDEQTYGVCGAELDTDDHREHRGADGDGDGGVCTAYLYGPARAAWVRCRRCRTQHETSRRVKDLRQRMDSMYFRAATLARLLPRLVERPVSASNIRNWRAEGKPIRTLTDDRGRPTYRAGDVIKVAIATPKRQRPAQASQDA